ncbi:MAG TPA: 30S ribosomal protein S15 [Thermoprotei archaeon]|nr:30S ribosomal protein S15 [Thermoprotei archaeon]
MARMHIRRKGKSHSKRPAIMAKPEWVFLKREEISELVIKLAKEGRRPSEIGMILRDQYGIPTFKQVMGVKLTKFLEMNGINYDLPEDLANLIDKARRLKEHLKYHKKDYRNKHSLELIEAKIHHLSKYYKRIGKLPKDWKYKTYVARVG